MHARAREEIHSRAFSRGCAGAPILLSQLPMLLQRARWAAPCLGLLALPACASSPVPWPPKDGSCVEAYKPRGRRAPWRYSIQGHPATPSEVEQLVDTSAATHERFRRDRTINSLFPTLFISGYATTAGGFLTAGLTRKPALLFLPLVGFATLVTGLVLVIGSEDPLRRAVWQYNRDAGKRGLCDRPARVPTPPGPADLSPAPPGGLPTLPSRGWIQ